MPAAFPGFAYDYDAAGNCTSVLESSGDRVTWTYDAANRLTREERSGASGYDTTYTYDALGNRLVKEASGALTTSTYDLANQLETSEDSSGVTTRHIRLRRVGQRGSGDGHDRQTASLGWTSRVSLRRNVGDVLHSGLKAGLRTGLWRVHA